jgi:hypothetical protein
MMPSVLLVRSIAESLAATTSFAKDAFAAPYRTVHTDKEPHPAATLNSRTFHLELMRSVLRNQRDC